MNQRTVRGLEALKRSANEAKDALPDLIKDRDDLLGQLNILNAQIQAAQMLVNAFQGDGMKPESHKDNPALPHPILRGTDGRAPRRLVYEHVRQLLESGGKFTEQQVRSEIDKKFGILYGRTSIYRALAQGLSNGTYERREGIWQMSNKGGQA